MDTAYIDYLGAKVTIEKDLKSFADFNNTEEVHKAVDIVFADRTERELISDGMRYRVYMRKQELGSLFMGIEEVYKMTHK